MNKKEIKDQCCLSDERDYGCNSCEENPLKNKDTVKQYSFEWYIEMRKLNKDTIISLVESNGKQRDILKEQLSEKDKEIFDLKAQIIRCHLRNKGFID